MVILPIEECNSILNEFEEVEDIRLYNQAKKDNEPSTPIDEAFKIIEANRKKGRNGLTKKSFNS